MVLWIVHKEIFALLTPVKMNMNHVFCLRLRGEVPHRPGKG